MFIINEAMSDGCLLNYLCLRGRRGLTQEHLMQFAKYSELLCETKQIISFHSSDVCQGMIYLQSKSLVYRYTQ